MAVAPLYNSEVKDYIRRFKESTFIFGSTPCDDSDYIDIMDYINCLRKRETSRIVYCARSPQRGIRALLIRYMLKVAEVEGLSWSTVHLAVYYFDRFTDAHTIGRKQIHIVLLTCLVIAGKLEEKDSCTPKIKSMGLLMPKDAEFNYRLFTQVEEYIIKYFDWQLMMPTIHTFLECFLLFAFDGISFQQASIQDANCNIDTSTSQDIELKIREYCFYILFCVMGAEPRDQFSHSCAAASILMYARRRHGYNFWTEKLAVVTGCSHWDVIECLDKYIDMIVPNDYLHGPLYQPHYLSFSEVHPDACLMLM